jgi:hypothetical protein
MISHNSVVYGHLNGVKTAKPRQPNPMVKVISNCGMQQLLASTAGTSAAIANSPLDPPSVSLAPEVVVPRNGNSREEAVLLSHVRLDMAATVRGDKDSTRL